MGVSRVVAPLADGETVQPAALKRLLFSPANKNDARAHHWGGGSEVHVVIMTLWFWNTAPVPREFLPLCRRLAPRAKVNTAYRRMRD
jgi:hypothetical protein